MVEYSFNVIEPIRIIRQKMHIIYVEVQYISFSQSLQKHLSYPENFIN